MDKNIGSKLGKDINNYIDQLIQELKSGGSDKFKEFLKFSSNFRKYSTNNMALIKMQLPTASQVGSFALWKSLGRSVKKGEKSLKIYGFSKYKSVTVNKKTQEETEHEFVAFPIVSVFDVSQTDGEEIPKWDIKPEGDDDKGLYDLLKKEIESTTDIKVIEEKLNGPLGTAQIGKIKVCTDQGKVSKFVSLTHELAHVKLGHVKPDCKLTRQQRECQAEATAYIVCCHFGIESIASVEYLLHWGNNEKEFKTHLDAVLKVSQEIFKMFGETKFEKQQTINNQKYANKNGTKLAA